MNESIQQERRTDSIITNPHSSIPSGGPLQLNKKRTCQNVTIKEIWKKRPLIPNIIVRGGESTSFDRYRHVSEIPLNHFFGRYSPKDIEPYVKLDFKTILDFYPAQCYSGTPWYPPALLRFLIHPSILLTMFICSTSLMPCVNVSGSTVLRRRHIQSWSCGVCLYIHMYVYTPITF